MAVYSYIEALEPDFLSCCLEKLFHSLFAREITLSNLLDLAGENSVFLRGESLSNPARPALCLFEDVQMGVIALFDDSFTNPCCVGYFLEWFIDQLRTQQRTCVL